VRLAGLRPSARLDEGGAAPLLRRHGTPQDLPRLVPSGAAQTEHPHALDAWLAPPRTGWRSEVPARPEGLQGFTPRETRGVMERTHAWHGRYRRPRKDDERRGAARTALLQGSHRPLMLKRRAPGDRPALHYRRDAAGESHDVAGGFPDSL